MQTLSDDSSELSTLPFNPEHLAALMLKYAPSFISLADLKGRILAISDALLMRIGKQREEVMLKVWDTRALMHPEDADAFIQHTANLYTSSKPLHLEARIMTMDGPCPTEWRIQLVRDAYQQPLYILSIGNDISDQKRAEELRHEQDTLRVKLMQEQELHERRSQFMSNLSHEFRTPLSTILVNTELLQHPKARYTTSEIQQKISRIRQQVLVLNHLIDDVYLATHPDEPSEPDYSDCDLVAITEHLIEDTRLAYHSEHAVVFCYEHWHRAHALADRRCYVQILVNLLSNAFKFSPPDSTVVVELKEAEDGLLLSVSDEGIGVPADDQKHLFSMYYRGSNIGVTRGLGLGLYLVADSTRVCAGEIHYEPLNPGSRFQVWLPIPPAATESD